jgi:hypothetical protein
MMGAANSVHSRAGGNPFSKWAPAFAGAIGVVVSLLSLPEPAFADPKTEDAAEVSADDEPRPFKEDADATAVVDAALANAKARGSRVLLVLGGNWCHDSRGLAAKFEAPELAALIAEKYELVWVDVGHRDRNMNVPRRFGVNDLLGTPTILILASDGMLLNADSVHDWRNADSRTLEETIAYFAKWSGDE